MPRRARVTVIALGLSGLIACSHAQKPTTPAVAAAPPAPAPVATPPPAPAPTPASPNVAVADDLGKKCALHFRDPQQAPKFDYDQFQLLPEDRDVLSQVASCITSGPLRGRKVQLVGRADPRGTEEYNLALGDRRARTVVDYLTRLGVEHAQVAVSTRGALDARGTDEATWQLDRRVDLELRN